MRALVTGGLGYLGHAVTVELLSAGWDVTVTSRGPGERGACPPSAANVVMCDLREAKAIATIVNEGGFDTVVHLAGLARARESFDEPLAYFDVNVGGTANLLRVLDELPAAKRPSLIYASTTLVYGSRYVGAVDENHEPSPESPYADTKVAAERLIAAQANTGRLAAAILRVFNVGGAVDGVGDVDPTRIIPNLLRAAAGQAPSVTLVGNGTAIRDFVHVADVARAVRMATGIVRTGACPIYNVGRLIADIRYATGALGWEPERSALHEIIKDAWACWQPAQLWDHGARSA
jgi:UDP-glucose 4-epimerase